MVVTGADVGVVLEGVGVVAGFFVVVVDVGSGVVAGGVEEQLKIIKFTFSESLPWKRVKSPGPTFLTNQNA